MASAIGAGSPYCTARNSASGITLCATHAAAKPSRQPRDTARAGCLVPLSTYRKPAKCGGSSPGARGRRARHPAFRVSASTCNHATQSLTGPSSSTIFTSSSVAVGRPLRARQQGSSIVGSFCRGQLGVGSMFWPVASTWLGRVRSQSARVLPCVSLGTQKVSGAVSFRCLDRHFVTPRAVVCPAGSVLLLEDVCGARSRLRTRSGPRHPLPSRTLRSRGQIPYG